MAPVEQKNCGTFRRTHCPDDNYAPGCRKIGKEA
jgi:hypothetical protein